MKDDSLSVSFPELYRLQNLLTSAGDLVRTRTLGTVKIPATSKSPGHDFPILSFTIGSQDKSAPTLGLFAGVHGLERIGSQLLLSYFESLFAQWRWDKELARRFENVRLVTIPIVNPGGMFLGRRSNPNGVDLNRNSPVEALDRAAWLWGGHRWGPRLPYFRGNSGNAMEIESQALVEFVREEIFPARSALVLDVHSGFGAKDRLWFPYAKTKQIFPLHREVQAFRQLLDQSYPNHVYAVEAQSLSYTTHGDLWDHLFDEHQKFYAGRACPTFIPWTLEMGSWLWVRKNPAQLFSALGVFNPVKLHRHRRIMRRHLPLLDFFLRATKHFEAWAAPGENL